MICETGVLPKGDPDIVSIVFNDGCHVVGALAVAIADALERRLAEMPGIKTFAVGFEDGPRVDANGVFTDGPGLPAYGADRETIQEFIEFCRSCADGDFEAWLRVEGHDAVASPRLA